MGKNSEAKELMDRMTEFVYPKFMKLQEKFTGEKTPGMFKMMKMMKMMKIIKDFSKGLKKEYKEKYGRDLEEDSKRLTELMGVESMNPMNMFNLFKSM